MAITRTEKYLKSILNKLTGKPDQEAAPGPVTNTDKVLIDISNSIGSGGGSSVPSVIILNFEESAAGDQIVCTNYQNTQLEGIVRHFISTQDYPIFLSFSEDLAVKLDLGVRGMILCTGCDATFGESAYSISLAGVGAPTGVSDVSYIRVALSGERASGGAVQTSGILYAAHVSDMGSMEERQVFPESSPQQ